MDNDDLSYVARNADEPWSLTTPDSDTLRFEVSEGDYAAMDASNYTKNERSDVIFINTFAMQTPIETDTITPKNILVARRAS